MGGSAIVEAKREAFATVHRAHDSNKRERFASRLDTWNGVQLNVCHSKFTSCLNIFARYLYYLSIAHDGGEECKSSHAYPNQPHIGFRLAAD